MRFVLAGYGGRGDIEPSVVVGRELAARGHDVLMAVPPNLIGFAEAAGLEAVAYGLDSREILEAQRKYWTCYFRTPWKLKELAVMNRATAEFASVCWEDMTRTLPDVARGADLLLTGLIFEQPAVNVAEAFDIPLAAVHFFPMRPNGQLLPFLPAPMCRAAMTLNDEAVWRGTSASENAQRRALGLPDATTPVADRVARRGALEIQAYDTVCFPGLVREWEDRARLRPFVGALAMEQPTGAEEDVLAWISAGTPPVCFGFGSVPVQSAADTLAMIDAACAQLGVRALVCAGSTDFGPAPRSSHVKVVGQVNYAAIFPRCAAVVHHGGAGTLAAALRAAVPQLVLWTLPDQPFFAAQLKRMKVGAGRRFAATTTNSLVSDLRKISNPRYRRHAQVVAEQMSTPRQSAAAAADRIEAFVARPR